MKCLALFALASITVVSAAGAALLPEWQLNDRFIIDQQIGVDIAIPEVALSLDVQTSDMVWHVAERSMQTVETCPVSYEVYRLPADAAVTASGQAHVFYPVQIDLMIRLTQAEVTCEAWVRTRCDSPKRDNRPAARLPRLVAYCSMKVSYSRRLSWRESSTSPEARVSSTASVKP